MTKSGAVLITGGLGGVMKSASHGAKEADGIVACIIPQNDASFANEYCDIVIPTGIRLARDFLTALAGDWVIIIGGGQELFQRHVLPICTRDPWLQSKISAELQTDMQINALITGNK